jgi:protein-S-isoprenylcysteine O-methyltransferase Ste14
MRSLAARTIFQSVGFFGVMFVLVFLPGGTVHDLRAWVFLGVFSGASTVATVWLFATDRALLERRLAMGERGEALPKQRVIQRILGVAFVGILVGSGLDRRFGWSHVSVALSWAADGCIVLSFALILWVFRANTFTSAVVEVAVNQTVVTTGPYRFVRHPMYTGALPLVFGAPLALGSYVAEVFSIVLAIGVVVRLLDEERFLKKELAGYEAYTQKTPWRLVPFVW